jgi:cysteine desulfurase family protein (TIGR01976 family)
MYLITLKSYDMHSRAERGNEDKIPNTKHKKLKRHKMQQPIFNMDEIRSKFPALAETDESGKPFAYFDGPGGTQVPQTVLDAMTNYFTKANANHGGRFITSRRNDATVESARAAMADFLNAETPREIVFGANMTTLTYNLSRVIGRRLREGDEIVVTRLDHDANVAPWASLEENGVVLKYADFKTEDCRLDMAHLGSLINENTRLVAVGYASNAVGTVNPIQAIAAMAHAKGAWIWVDAVHFAPHGPIDVQVLDCDFLVCSAYKYFGPHVGVLYAKHALLDELEAYKVRPADPEPPYKFETGTLNHEGLAGVAAAVDYLADIGRQYGGAFDPKRLEGSYVGRRKELKQAMGLIVDYERTLFNYLLNEIRNVPGVRIYGITDSAALANRCPTLAFTKTDKSPQEIAEQLGNQGIFVWDGNYYAISVTETLGLEASGGMVRVGLAHYNTREEVDRLIAALKLL